MVHTWDSETGVALESFAGQGAALTAVGFTAEKKTPKEIKHS